MCVPIVHPRRHSRSKHFHLWSGISAWNPIDAANSQLEKTQSVLTRLAGVAISTSIRCLGLKSSGISLKRCCPHAASGAVHQGRIADARPLLLTVEHQPIASGPTATLRRCGATTAQAKRIWVFGRSAFLNVHDTELPLPHVQQVADVEELLLAMRAKLSQGLRSRATPEAVELLPVDPKGVSEIATPAQYPLDDIMQIAQFSVLVH